MSNTLSSVLISETCFRSGNSVNSVTFKISGENAVLTLNSASIDLFYFTLSYQGHFFSTNKTLYSSLSSNSTSGSTTLERIMLANSMGIEFCSLGYPIKLLICSTDKKSNFKLALDLKYMSNNHQMKMQNLTDNIVKSLVREIDLIKSKLEFRGNSSDISSMQTCLLESFQSKLEMQDKALADLQLEILDLKSSALEKKELDLKYESLKKSFDNLSDKINGDHCKTLLNLKDNIDDLQIKVNPLLEEFEKNTKENSARHNQILDLEQRMNEAILPFKSKIEECKSYTKSLMTESYKSFEAKLDKLEKKLNDQNSYFRKSFEFISQDLKFTKTEFSFKVNSILEQNNQANPKSLGMGTDNTINSVEPTKKYESYTKKYSKSGYAIISEYKHDNHLYSLADYGNSEYIVGCSDGSIHFRSKANHQITRTLPNEHSKGVYVLMVIGDQLVSGSTEKVNNLKLWNLSNSNQKSSTLLGHTGSVYCLAQVKPHIISSGSSDNSIMLWDLNKKANIGKLLGHTSVVWGLVMNNDNTLISVGFDGTIRLWDLTNITNTYEIKDKRITDDNEKFISLLNINKTSIAVGTNNGKIKIWDIEKKELMKTLGEHSNWVTRIVRLSPTQMGSCSCDKTIRIWNTESLTQVAVLDGHTDYVNGIIMLDASKLLSISYDQSLKIWASK